MKHSSPTTLNKDQTGHTGKASSVRLTRIIPIELYSLSFSRTAAALRPCEGRALTYSLSTFRNDMFLLISSLVLFTFSWISKGKKGKVKKDIEKYRPGSRRTSYDSESTTLGWAPHGCDRTGMVFFSIDTRRCWLLSSLLACETGS